MSHPVHRCVHELFEDQAERTPDAIALIFRGGSITYAELNRRANRLAHFLSRLGVGLESTVGLCLDRSPDLVIAKLAVMKAGGTCLPMAPSFPAERMAFLLEDTAAKALLTLQSTLPKVPRSFRPVVCLDTDGGSIAAMPVGEPRAGVDPANLSYVIHTSGSTGVPKGVQITHRGVVRNIMTANPFSFAGDDTVLHYAPVTFDAATFEIFGTLLLGARLAIADPGELTLEELGENLERYGVTTAWLGTVLFHQMVEYRIEDLRRLRKVVSGGESLSVRHVRNLRRELPGCELINGYGPTENTMFSTAWQVETLPDGASNVPIGPAVGYCTAAIVDRALSLVSSGGEGEVWVGGAGLARGYWERPELTAEKFVPDPFGSEPGGRLYRSGDLGRLLPGGEIEFLGRIDRLVKIDGFRVEPGEVEAVLSSHPDIGECVVTAPADPATGRRRLVAYFVARQPTAAGELESYLEERLPGHMVPRSYVALARLPVNPNGKVDHRALPAVAELDR